MGITKMFRDRVVSLEQTLELGEKNLPLLVELIGEALPGWEAGEHDLAHEADLFVVRATEPASGAVKRIAFTRMVLADASCVPAIADAPKLPARERIVECIRRQAERDEIRVTFRAVMNDEDRQEAESVEAEWNKAQEAARAAQRAEDERRERERRARKQEEARRRAQQEKDRARKREGAEAKAAAGGPGPAGPPGGRKQGRRRGERRRQGRPIPELRPAAPSGAADAAGAGAPVPSPGREAHAPAHRRAPSSPKIHRPQPSPPAPPPQREGAPPVSEAGREGANAARPEGGGRRRRRRGRGGRGGPKPPGAKEPPQGGL